MSARTLIAAVAEEFTELPPPAGAVASPSDGPLAWPGYGAALERARRRTGEAESVVCGIATTGPAQAVVIGFEFGFLGGSIGERTGDRVVNAMATATELGLPVVSLIATGGSRMPEGMPSTADDLRLRPQDLVPLGIAEH